MLLDKQFIFLRVSFNIFVHTSPEWEGRTQPCRSLTTCCRGLTSSRLLSLLLLLISDHIRLTGALTPYWSYVLSLGSFQKKLDKEWTDIFLSESAVRRRCFRLFWKIQFCFFNSSLSSRSFFPVSDFCQQKNFPYLVKRKNWEEMQTFIQWSCTLNTFCLYKSPKSFNYICEIFLYNFHIFSPLRYFNDLYECLVVNVNRTEEAALPENVYVK